jgi:hypothetical protein
VGAIKEIEAFHWTQKVSLNFPERGVFVLWQPSVDRFPRALAGQTAFIFI